MSEVTYTYQTKDQNNNVIYVECSLEYEELEVGSWSNGLQVEPNYPVSMLLLDAWIKGVSIYSLLSDDTILDIETKALAYREEYYE